MSRTLGNGERRSSNRPLNRIAFGLASTTPMKHPELGVPMPFTHIALAEGKPVAYRQTLMEQIYLAMRDTVAIPEHDRFATISEHKPENLVIWMNTMSLERSMPR